MRFNIRFLTSHLSYIAALALACYANTLGNGFVFDDSAYLASDAVRGLALGELFGASWMGLELYRPLTLLSLGFDFQLFGEAPWGYHLTNVLLHTVNSLLLYALARDLLGEDRAALWAALLYASHPLQTEVVAWISARGDLLASLLSLSALLAHRRQRVLAYLLYAGACLSKETAMILPIALFLADSRKGVAAWSKRHWGYGVALLGVLALRWLALTDAPAGPVSTNFLADLDLWQRLGTAVAILPRYLLLIVAPLYLSADYSYASIPPVASPWDLWFVAGLACVAALVALYWVARSRFLIFTSAFFAACLLPVANLLFLAPSGMAERYLHLAMIPVALTWGWAGQCWLRRSPGQRRLIWAMVLCVVVLGGVRTIVRNRDWHSDARLFAAVLEHYPDNARAHDNLAFTYYQQGQYARAFHHYQRAVAIQPTRLRAHFNLGILHSAARRYEEAIASFKAALALNPTRVETHFNLGLTYQKAGRYEEAIKYYGTVLRLAPHHLRAYYNLGRAYERVGRIEDAIRQYTALVALDSEAVKAYYRLGELYRRQQRFAEMAAAWTTLLRLDPAHREAERIRQALGRGK